MSTSPRTPDDPLARDETVVPDGKDWTWVVERRCPECGFDAAGVPRTALAPLLRKAAGDWPAIASAEWSRRRPAPAIWSPLEYAAHVRDAVDLARERLALSLAEDDPEYESWDQDAAAVAGRYGEQDPSAVADQVGAALLSFAAAVDAVPEGSWGRTGRRTDGYRLTVDSLVRYFAHDVMHHLWDARPRA